MDINFTIVIPLYNKANHIERAINSIKNQTYKNFELIVVNDGSTDGSDRIVEEINFKNLRIIHKKNGGESTARNTGIKEAQSEYICFLDADDEWQESFLKTIHDLIKIYPDVSGYATRIINSASLESSSKENIETNNQRDSSIIQNYFRNLRDGEYLLSSSSICIKKEVFNETGLFNENLKIGPDIDMWIRVFINGGIAISQSIEAIYHTDAENRSIERLDFNERELDFFKHIRASYLTRRLNSDFYSSLDKWSRDRIYTIIIRSIYQNQKHFAIKTLLSNIQILKARQVIYSAARIITPNKLASYLKIIIKK